MQSLITLYGKGAVRLLHHDKNMIASDNGMIHVPESLVPQMLALGFSRSPVLGGDLTVGELQAETLAKLEAASAGAISRGDALEEEGGGDLTDDFDALDSASPEVIDVSADGVASRIDPPNLP